MTRLARIRALRIVLLLLATLIAVPISLALRGVFPPKLNVASIAHTPSYQSPKLLEEAWRLPVAAAYRKSLLFQSNGSLCGPTSVANVQRSFGQLGVDAASVLEGTGKCWTGVCWGGVSLDELAEIARHATGRKATVLRNFSLAQFRDELRHVNAPTRRYIANFQRAPLFGVGGGHHSPVAGYFEPRDLVLVLDVNENFRPWLVETERLFTAIDTLDGEQKCGLLRIE